jgi:mycothiol synthase
MGNPEKRMDQPQLVMYRRDLKGLPPVELSGGYEIRHYQSGDDEGWEMTIEESFGLQCSFAKTMKADEAFQPERIWFVCLGGEMAATASAWYRPKWGRDMGYLHMVGTRPSHSGRGLGYQVSLAALHQMAREGRLSAILETDDFRVPAIKTYLKLGFLPLLVHENQRKRWEDVFLGMGRGELVDRFGDILKGPLYDFHE